MTKSFSLHTITIYISQLKNVPLHIIFLA